MKNMEDWNRDDINNWIDNLESVKKVKELNKWLDAAKENFPEAKIRYKIKTSEEWNLYK